MADRPPTLEGCWRIRLRAGCG